MQSRRVNTKNSTLIAEQTYIYIYIYAGFSFSHMMRLLTPCHTCTNHHSTKQLMYFPPLMDYQESSKNKSRLICMIHLDMFAQCRSKPKLGHFVSQLFPHNIYQIADFREWGLCLLGIYDDY